MSTSDRDETTRLESGTPVYMREPRTAEQFAPGTLIAGRYRIAGLLGSGGMGEVYRADDVKLDQVVALKFLPARLAADQMLLMQLHDEVRLGRLIAHPNVCRIYDIGEFGATHFVAMEYVDGEDLRRLLHRIGRLPHDKAVEITRGVAAGLHAAHVKGILHRDLKPANVMLDSQGYARITDFGLALSAEHAEAGGVAGTPAYMAPEQLEGAAASVQTDLYSLGVLMYELFTGKRPFTGGTFAELRREVSSSEITMPSLLVRELEPAVERVILRCLNRDPALRPRSAREIIDALPGDDPLAAAMAAGETPSPKIIAAAGSEGSLRPAMAWTLLGAAAILLALVSSIRSDSLLRAVGFDKRPEALADRAHEVLRAVGVPQQRYAATGFADDAALVLWNTNQHKSERRPWDRLRRGPAAVTFWLRESATPLFVPRGALTADDPPLTPGSSAAAIDRRGRLTHLRVAPAAAWQTQPAVPFDASRLLAAAGFQAAALRPAAPHLLPPGAVDHRQAWSGTHPDDGTPVHLEAASWRGIPVLFSVSGAWDEQAGAVTRQAFAGGAVVIFVTLMIVSAVVISLFFALRNFKLRRGDRLGAMRVAAAMFLLTLAARLADADHAAAVRHEIMLVRTALEHALFSGALMYVFYLALEPYARRRWPHRMIAWTRLLAGDVRNPMIGRDVLIGTIGGLLHATIALATTRVAAWFGMTPDAPQLGDESTLRGLRHGFASLFDHLTNGVTTAFTLLMVLTVLTIILRRRWLATAALLVLLQFAYVLAAQGNVPVLIASVALVALTALMTVRLGILAAVVAQTSFLFTFQYGASLDGTPYVVEALFPIVVVSAFSLWAFRTSLGGQSPWRPGLLDD